MRRVRKKTSQSDKIAQSSKKKCSSRKNVLGLNKKSAKSEKIALSQNSRKKPGKMSKKCTKNWLVLKNIKSVQNAQKNM